MPTAPYPRFADDNYVIQQTELSGPEAIKLIESAADREDALRRPWNWSLIRRLTELMDEGYFNGWDMEPLAIANTGRLIDGFQRLYALYLWDADGTKPKQKFLISRGMDESRADFHGTTGKARTVTTVLRLHGEKYYGFKGGGIRWYQIFRNHNQTGDFSKLSPPRPDIVLNEIDAYGRNAIDEFCYMVSSARAAHIPVSQVVLLGLLMEGNRGMDDYTIAQLFVDGVRGDDTAPGDPRTVLLNTYDSEVRKYGPYTGEPGSLRQAALLTNAWNDWLLGKSLRFRTYGRDIEPAQIPHAEQFTPRRRRR